MHATGCWAELSLRKTKAAARVNNLRGVLYTQGNLPGAREARLKALWVFERFLPLDHPNIQTLRRIPAAPGYATEVET